MPEFDPYNFVEQNPEGSYDVVLGGQIIGTTYDLNEAQNAFNMGGFYADYGNVYPSSYYPDSNMPVPPTYSSPSYSPSYGGNEYLGGMPSQGDTYPFQMDDGSFGFWYQGIFYGFPDQTSAERAYNTKYGLSNAGVQVRPSTTTTRPPTSTPSRPGAPQFPGVNVDPALEYKKWAAQHALDVAREVFNVTRGDIDRSRTAAAGVLSFYNDFAGQFGYSPNLNFNDLYSALYGPQVDWQQVLSDWGLDVSGGGSFASAAGGGGDTRPRSVDEARAELQAAGASPADLANDAWARNEYQKLSNRAVI